MSNDPLGLAVATRISRYVMNDPLLSVDPTGESTLARSDLRRHAVTAISWQPRASKSVRLHRANSRICSSEQSLGGDEAPGGLTETLEASELAHVGAREIR